MSLGNNLWSDGVLYFFCFSIRELKSLALLTNTHPKTKTLVKISAAYTRDSTVVLLYTKVPRPTKLVYRADEAPVSVANGKQDDYVPSTVHNLILAFTFPK
jgi:hypothetical protein